MTSTNARKRVPGWLVLLALTVLVGLGAFTIWATAGR